MFIFVYLFDSILKKYKNVQVYSSEKKFFCIFWRMRYKTENEIAYILHMSVYLVQGFNLKIEKTS